MYQLIIFLLGIPAIMVATTIHEFTRAAVSTALGDSLPKERGRLTLNPLRHFEPIGLILMLACGFGWGKRAEIQKQEQGSAPYGRTSHGCESCVRLRVYVPCLGGVKHRTAFVVFCENSLLLLLSCCIQFHTRGAYGLR